MKQPTLFNLVRKIFYYSDVTIAVCECHEQKLRFEYYFKNEWDGYIRLPNARKHLNPRRRRPSGFIIVFEFLEITSPTKKISRNYHFNLFELWTCNLLGTRWCVTSEQTRCFTIHMVECRFGCPKTCEEEETCVASAIRMSTRYKTKRAAGIFDDWRRARFRKVATLKPGGLFKHYDLHKAASLEVSLVKKDALGLHLFKKLPNH